MGCGTVRQRDLSSTQDRSPAPFDAWCCLLAAKFIIVKYAQLNPSLSGIELILCAAKRLTRIFSWFNFVRNEANFSDQ